MSISEKSRPCSASSSLSPMSVHDFDPLLKDLNERKQSFRRNVVSLASELKDVRSRLASQEQSFVKETLTRQEAETKAKHLEEEISIMQKRVEQRNQQLEVSASAAEKFLTELDGLRSQLSATQATADISAASAQSAQLQCLALLKELDEKNCSLKEQDDRVIRLGEQLDNLQKDLKARECSQKQLKDEVLRIENDIMQAIAKAGVNKDCELRKILDEVSPKNIEKINKLLVVKDEEIAKLKDEIRVMSAHWKLKTKEFESQVHSSHAFFSCSFFYKVLVNRSVMKFNNFLEQLEKQRRIDQELKKRVLKLEFCLQEARAQTRKLQRMGERRDKALKELKDQLQRGGGGAAAAERQNFWETSGFKIMMSMSMLILVVFSKR
nr:nuclear envelope-associated protein 2-like isoform X1 [Malus domestica]XP_028957213.1 nuclear envelope-associated protein 2-like isoform X1 [Malus domestica]XP_028957214.1 nuclear envelope-associated protein 2-like isoform X1 [Malus domestica]XP_028957215.1 nuclear envelope-associated protein 2-like isoform X1 [Malus domestica]